MTVQTDLSTKGKSSGGHGGGWLSGWKKTSKAFLGTFSLMVLGLILVISWESSGSGAFTLLFTAQEPQKLIDLRVGDAVKANALLASSEELDESADHPLNRSISVHGRLGKTLLGSLFDQKARCQTQSTLTDLTSIQSYIKYDHTPSLLCIDDELRPALCDPDGVVVTDRKREIDASVWRVTDEGKIDVGHSSSLHDELEVGLQRSTIGGYVEPNVAAVHQSESITEEETASETEPEPSRMPIEQTKKSPTLGRAALIGGDEASETMKSDSGSSSESKVCDLTRGYWVKDETRPLYSGKECKAYLSRGFACRLMTRPDFEYEKLRWQPEGCDLPSFSGSGFLRRLQNKVVAFVGDSLGRQQFQYLMCMITEGKDGKSVEDVQRKWGRDTKWAYRFRETNTTILFHWTVSLCKIEEGHPGEELGFSAMHLDRPVSFLEKSFDKIDVLVLNTGHHWNRGKLESNKWHRYVNGEPLVDKKLNGIGQSLNLTVHKVVQWLDEKLAEGKHHPAVFLRTLSPRHFKNGDWNSGGRCDSSRASYGLNATQEVKPSLPVYKGPITDRIAEFAVKGTRVALLNVTHLSQFREEGHISKYGIGKDSKHQDCLHWCLPGVPDVWNELLYANLLNDPSLSPTSEHQASVF